MAGHIGRGCIGTVGSDCIDRTCAEKSHVGHVVHGERRVVHAIDYTFAHDSCGRAMTNAQTIGQQQNHVLCLTFFRGVVGVPNDSLVAALTRDGYLVGAWFLDFDIAHQNGGGLGINFFTDKDFVSR